MKRIALLLSIVAGGAAATARATLYHPELLKLSARRPPLIDCGQGFDAALKEYFTHFADRDGVPVPATPVLRSVERDQSHWVSRFELSAGPKTYRGVIYVEPPIEDDDDGDLPVPPLPQPHQRFCSAVFADEAATPAENAQLEALYQQLSRHFSVKP